MKRRAISLADAEYALDPEEQARLLAASIAHADSNPPVDWDSLVDGSDLGLTEAGVTARASAQKPRSIDQRSTAAADGPSEHGKLFEIVAEHQVGIGLTSAARMSRRVAVEKLGLSRSPAIRFYRAASSPPQGETFRESRPIDGFANRDTHEIFVRIENDPTPRHVVEVVAHEVCHCAQGEVGEREEAEAVRFGQWVAGIVGGGT